MTDAASANKVTVFAERLIALAETYRADVAVVIDQAKAADVDAPALRRLAAWMRKDEIDRLEQEAVDDQYRFLAGLAAAPAELPAEGQLETAAALFADKMTIRAVAKEMGISVGKAHQLKIKAAAFNVHREMNVNMPAHDPETGELSETPDLDTPAGGDEGTAENEAASALVAAEESCGSTDGRAGRLLDPNCEPERDEQPASGETHKDRKTAGTPEMAASGTADINLGPQDPIDTTIPAFLRRVA